MRQPPPSRPRKKLPGRSLDMARSRSPACPVNILSRCPLRSAVRVPVCLIFVVTLVVQMRSSRYNSFFYW